jgi:hypothetical protein
MAVVVHFVERVPSAGDNGIRNDVQGLILAIENTVDNTAALIQARAVSVLNSHGMDLPAGYFNANRQINTPNFPSAGKCVVFAGDKIIDV